MCSVNQQTKSINENSAHGSIPKSKIENQKLVLAQEMDDEIDKRRGKKNTVKAIEQSAMTGQELT